MNPLHLCSTQSIQRRSSEEGEDQGWATPAGDNCDIHRRSFIFSNRQELYVYSAHASIQTLLNG
jgi:hypothetical protein